MNRQEFNKDLGEYINMKKGGRDRSLFSFISRFPAVVPYGKARERGNPPQKMSQLKQQEKELEKMEAKIEQIDDIERTVEEKREGLLKGFFKKMGMFNKQKDEHILEVDESEEEQEEPINEDVKHVLKLTYGWLDYLPEEKVMAFKRSEDFDVYKRVLTQHGLIKQPQESAPAEEAAEQDAENAAKDDDF